MITRKYIRNGFTKPSHYPEFTSSPVYMDRFDTKDGKNFSIHWAAITKPFVMVEETHKHDFDQYLCFIGGDPTDTLYLGGEVELTLSEDGINLEKHVFTNASTVFIPEGLYHCPLNFKKVDKPMLFINIYFAATEYERKT